jgi:uncharacterized protein YdiU (UPF0061 family)
MFHLGVPTTRALSLVLTGDKILRDMFYDGNPGHEKGAIVCRVAPSFLRFGSFEMAAAQADEDLLRTLVNYTMKYHYPELREPSVARYAEFFHAVCTRTAKLMVEWMRVGFVHGVMNTDNLSILGLTIDYGPYGWLEGYDPNWTPNTTDRSHRRYRYGAQPKMALWNLVQLANALYPLIGAAEPLQAALDQYGTLFEELNRTMMGSKLGFDTDQGREDDELVATLLTNLELTEIDMTLFYRGLANVPASRSRDGEADALLAYVADAFYDARTLKYNAGAQMEAWLQAYSRRVAQESRPCVERQAAMNVVNPKFVMRNYLAQEAIDLADQGDYSRLNELLDVMRTPYEDRLEKASFAQKRPEWARNRPGCSMLSCSS